MSNNEALEENEDSRIAALERKNLHLLTALGDYMAAFGQALEANGLPFNIQQELADLKARAAIKESSGKL